MGSEPTGNQAYQISPENQLGYWREQLFGAPTLLELPTDKSSSKIPPFRVASLESKLPKSSTDALKELSHQEGLTLYTSLLAVFQTLLLRYSGQEDIVVVSPVPTHVQVDDGNSNGSFGNSLALRTDLSGDPTFRELLKRVDSVVREAYQHRDVPYQDLIRELYPELNQETLYQIGYVLTDGTGKESNADDKYSFEMKHEPRKRDLTLWLNEDADGLSASIDYNKELFDESRIQRMLGHFQVLIDGTVSAPEQKLSNLPLLTAREREQLLVEWNNTQTEYSSGKTIHQLFEDRVSETPESVAVVFEGQQLSYEELNERANQLAHHLQKLGVESEVMVAICLERSLEMAVGLLGILKAGGAYVPVDPQYPRERLSFMLKDTRTPVLLTQERLLDRLPESSAQVICLDRDRKLISEESRKNPNTESTPENLAYVIYTSGSSGRPKGVMVRHQGVVNYLSWCVAAYEVAEGSGSLVHSSIGFDLTITSLFSPLLAGRQVVLLPEDEDVESLATALGEGEDFSLIKITPAHLEVLSKLIAAEKVDGSVKALVIGGEALWGEDLVFWRDHAPATRIINEYGPTETVVGCCVYEAAAGATEAGPVPIGRPIANTQLYIMDRHLRPVPVGVPGELYIGGDGLARGYVNRPDLTSEKFIPHPYSREGGARLYRSGDLVRYQADGNIEFLGRIDQQVKIRGYRIELGEIEAVLSEHPAISQSVVIAREEDTGDKRLLAYVVPRDGAHLRIGELRSHLKQKLPDFMLPSGFIVLTALPLTPSAKVDRRSLPASDHFERELEEPFVAPRDDLELELKKLWEAVLGINPIGVTDNFFELGGFSTIAVQLFFHLERRLGKHLPIATLYQAPTIEQLAKILCEGKTSPSWSSLVVIQPKGAKPPFFCIHPGGANVLCYYDLARRLGPEQPVYAFQAQGLDGKKAPYSRVEDMAGHYIKELRLVQPVGPYYLGGLSFGGLVAFEMAQQLLLQGQKVGLLALLSTDFNFNNLPNLDFEDDSEPDEFLLQTSLVRIKVAPHIQRISDHMSELLRVGPKTYFLDRARQIRKRIEDVGVNPLVRTIAAIAKAKDNYVPKPYSGRITLFLGTESSESSSQNKRLAWNELAADGLEVEMVPGNHLTIRYNPNVKVLAKRLTICLERSQADNSMQE